MPGELYDEMADMGEGEGLDDDMAMDDMAESEPELDAEFATHASEAGFDTPEKQRALKSAIERCYALKDEAAGEEEVAESNLEDLGAEGEEDAFAALS